MWSGRAECAMRQPVAHPTAGGSSFRFGPVTTGPSFGWALAAGLGVLLALAVVVSRIGRVGVERGLVTASVRAVLQLLVMAAVIGAVLQRLWASMVFAVVISSSQRSRRLAGWGRVEISRGWRSRSPLASCPPWP